MRHKQVGARKMGVINPDGHTIGLDIGSSSIRAAILSPGHTDGQASVTVHGLGHVDIPVGVVVNGSVVDQGAVTRAVKKLWSDNRFECKHVILGIANSQSVVRDLDMPQLTPDQLIKALPYQAREIVAIPMDQALLDFIPMDGPQTGDLVRGLLVAVPRSPVLAAVQAVEKAGLKVARVDLSSFAILRSIADSGREVEAVVDMGSQLTNVIIHHHGVPKVVRSVPRGGAELTARIADRAGMTEEDAEVAKCLNGLSGRDRHVVDAITDGIRPLLAEVRSSIQYFASTNGNVPLQRLSLTGRAANLPGLAELLGDQLNVETVVAEPMRHIRNRFSPGTKDKFPETSASAVSIGLAMGAAA